MTSFKKWLDPYKYTQLIYDKDVEQFNRGARAFFKNGPGATGHPKVNKMNSA